MFSRGDQRFRGSPNGPSGKKKDELSKHDSPLNELIYCMDRMEELIEKIRSNNPLERKAKSIGTDNDKEKTKRMGWRRGGNAMDTKNSTEKNNAPKDPNARKPKHLYCRKEREAKFLPVSNEDEEELIELLRRTAELVIMGERGAAAALRKQEDQRERLEQGKEVDVKVGEDSNFDTFMAIFEQFFERNTLSLIVNIVTGVAFSSSRKEDDTSTQNSDLESLSSGAPSKEEACAMLPTLPIATQAVQSVSILIQNVSHATSLYFLLSNNHINELIELPLELYTIAESNKRQDNSNGYSPSKYSSPEIAELTTHFVSFLKSLALRMNTETLQFFLTYPAEHSGEVSGEVGIASSAHFSEDNDTSIESVDSNIPLDEIETNMAEAKSSQSVPVPVEKVEVQFPLYARALEFCSPHQDSFVRVTAMNVCLNTLRLAVIGPRMGDTPATGDDNVKVDELVGPATAQRIDGVLHNAEPLPLRERLAIAQHVCAPSRVEGLISPIFTKLAQLWGMLEEVIRDMDSSGLGVRGSGSVGRQEDDFRGRVSKSDKAKQEVRNRRLSGAFSDAVANLQDELELLEDVFKVGMTSLNEQIIEMMLATFVYPLLLQPLLSFMQRFPSKRASPGESWDNAGSDLFNDNEVDSDFLSDNAETSEYHETAPAKTAFFTLASVFHLITNRPLLRLLMTALFHPLAPETSGESMIRAKPDVACRGSDSKVYVRVDEPMPSSPTIIPNDKSTYLFGKVTGRRGSGKASPLGAMQKDDHCVFVLSPALADVLESDGRGAEGAAFLARTRPNPYRRAILSCLAETGETAGLGSLAVLALDAALSRFDGKFVDNILFGTEMKTFNNEMTFDERRQETKKVRKDNDRGMGGPMYVESRRTLKDTPSRFGGDSSFGSNFVAEVVASLCVGVVRSSKWNGIRTLEFDMISAHALLCAIKDNPRALQMTAKLIQRRCGQTASFLSQLPSLLDKARVARVAPVTLFSGEEAALGPKAIVEDDDQCLGQIMDRMFYDKIGSKPHSVVEGLVRIREGGNEDKQNVLIAVTSESSFEDLALRVCSSEMEATFSGSDELMSLEIASKGASSHLQLDAFSTLLQELAATNGTALKNRKVAEFAFMHSGTIINTNGSFEKEIRSSIYAPVTQNLVSTLLQEQDEDKIHHRDKGPPATGSVVGLVGRTAFPCVCEVPAVNAKLFTDEAACVVAEGVKWQSLYLVFLGRYMILAEPERGGSGGNGRVIASCGLARLKVAKGDVQSTDNDSPARRLLLSYEWYEEMPPGLFLLEEQPIANNLGPFARVQSHRSCLDLWFEDESAADRAYIVIDIKVNKARTRRGNRIREKLA